MMLLLRHNPAYPNWVDAIADGTLLLIFTSPILYFFLFRPLALHIRERNKAVDALVKSQEEQFKAMVSTSLDGFWITNRHGHFLAANDAYCHLIGYNREELLGMSLYDVDTLADPRAIKQHIRNIIENGSHRFEANNRTKDGRVLIVEASANYSEAGGGKLYCFIRDITERREREEALRLAGSVFNNVEEAVLVTDAKGNIIAVNPAFTTITGYSPEEAVGKTPDILSSGRHPAEFYRGMWQQLQSTGSWTGEIWDKRKNGEIYPKWMTISAVKDEDNATVEYVAIFSDITERKRAEEEILHLAFYDSLTKLPNRRLLLDRIRTALSMSARNHLYGALLFLDMDRFKVLNDTLGHDHGDLLLIEVAKRIQTHVREVDTVSRIGGDEFVVLFEGISESAEEASKKIALIAEKLRMALNAPYLLERHEHHCSPSIGVCMYCDDKESVDTLLKRADMAMYQAKDAGRNAVRFFDPIMQQAMEVRATLETDLRRAVLGQQLHLVYQLQVGGDHQPIGAEALVRWVHPERGLVMPAQFIPIAEESSLILDIGHWVLDTACRQLAEWEKQPKMRNLVLAVNVSAQQFRMHDFVGKVTAITNSHGINPARLKLELTESVVLNDVADVVKKMRALKDLGVKLSMDDFGMGYSSLAYLKQLPLDQLKIDQSFVRNIATDNNDAVMVQAIIDMALNFRMDVIAEGVETDAQFKFLRQNGCMAYQGYLFSKPVPIEEFEQKIADLTTESQATGFRLPHLFELAPQA
ncbi:MAG TPA: EAL domain-containing protein [Gallionella sp.]|nr:EAL domain-containing protein [Gallionella sp.]